jgi:hypothetical protein
MRRAISLSVLIVLMLALAPHAAAGGSWLHVDPTGSVGGGTDPSGVGWAGIGATVTMRGSFGTGAGAPVTGDTYFAYLHTRERGPVLLETVSVGPGGRYPFSASTTFQVPAVAPGRYLISVCTLGCAQGVGDLIGGYLWIGRTPQEARLHAMVDGLRIQVREARGSSQDAALLRERLRAARGSLEAVSNELDEAQFDLDLATSQRDRANQNRLEAQDATRAAQNESAQWRLTTYAVLAMVAVGVCVAIVRRRRYVRIRIPDSPRELTEPVATRRGRS